MIYSILRANGLIAKYVEKGSMVSLVGVPVKRSTIAFTQMMTLISSVVLLLVYVTLLEIFVAQSYFPNELVINDLLLLNGGLLCLHLLISGICFISSCIFSDTKYSIGFGAGIPTLMFVIQMIANMGEKAEKAKYFTFFTLFDPESLVQASQSSLISAMLLLVEAILLFSLSILVFKKKDLHI